MLQITIKLLFVHYTKLLHHRIQPEICDETFLLLPITPYTLDMFRYRKYFPSNIDFASTMH